MWIEARHFFSRGDAQNRCWLWLVRHDGEVRALVMPSHYLNKDDLLPDLVRIFDADQTEESLPGATMDIAHALPNAPIVPVPRWQVSWGHPMQRAIREFATHLDKDVLHTLGDLETPGPFFGSVANYNRLISLGHPKRIHRLQALTEFPPLVAPLLLDAPERPDMFGDAESTPAPKPQPANDRVLASIDQGRDLIGELAAYYRVDRALVRSAVCRTPWASGAIPAEALRLFATLPAHARPHRVSEAEPYFRLLECLPFATSRAGDMKFLANTFTRGWNETWKQLETIGQPLPTRLRITRDFLAAPLDQAMLPESLAGLSRENLGLAWVSRRGLESLLQASKRWHEQPLEQLPVPPPSLPPSALEPMLLETVALEGGCIKELLTTAALIEEGQRMHHCVADYWNDCLTLGTRIVHLQLPDGERATAEYGLHTDATDPRFSLEQLMGPCNAEVSATMDHLAHSVLGLLNAPNQHQRRLRVADAAHAMDKATHNRLLPRHTIRRLDSRSRRELEQVITWCERQEIWKQRCSELFCGCIAGLQYADGRHIIDQLQPGDALTLMREPDNPHDGHAVRVNWRDHKLGYIPRDQNHTIAALLDAASTLDAHIVAVNHGREPWQQVEIRVGRSEVTAARS